MSVLLAVWARYLGITTYIDEGEVRAFLIGVQVCGRRSVSAVG